MNDSFQYDVMNFGVIGYSIQDELKVLEYKVLPWAPDIIVWAYYLNDPEVRPTQPIQKIFNRPQWWEHFQLPRLMRQSRDYWNHHRLGQPPYYEYLHHPEGPHWPNIKKGFQDIRELTAGKDIPVVLFVFPEVPVGSWEDYAYRGIHEQVRQEAEKNHLETIDLLRVYQLFPPHWLRYSKKDHHPSKFGHQVTAAALFVHLSERWWEGNDRTVAGGDLLMTPPEVESFENRAKVARKVKSATASAVEEATPENE